LSTASSLSNFNAPPATHIYTLSLHDALPIYSLRSRSAEKPVRDEPDIAQNECRPRVATGTRVVPRRPAFAPSGRGLFCCPREGEDRKSTRLNSSHVSISYAVFCLKKKSR